MRRGAVAVVCAGAAVLLASCTSAPAPGPGDAPRSPAPVSPTAEPATWALADAAAVTPDAAMIEVLATRLECASGVTGDLEEPVVTYSPDEIVIRIDAADNGDGAADCQGNDAVPVTVVLSEPVGDRDLIDGACRDTAAVGTAFCESPVRWSP